MDQAHVESQETFPGANFTFPLKLDIRYNLAVCKEHSIALPFDWIQGHLKKNHGIRKQLEDIMEQLNIGAPTQSFNEVKDWISDTWILSMAIQDIPIMTGMTCKECNYSCVTKESMKNHFSAKHHGLKWVENIEQSKVQMPFQGSLKKYIQIEDAEGQETEMAAGNDWKIALQQEFRAAMPQCLSFTQKGPSDSRLLSAFVAKMRWDLCVKDMDLAELQKLAASPLRSDRLHKIILCGRNYIEKCCNALNGGNMMLKRRLMSAGYSITVKMN